MSFSPTMGVTAYDGGDPYDHVYDNSGPQNAILYEGSAYPGTADTSGVTQWRIRKFFYDSNGIISGSRWANGSAAFQFDWTLRATYTYTGL